MIQMNLLTKQKQTHRLREWTYGYPGEVWGGIVREFGIDRYTLLYLKWITRDFLSSPVVKSPPSSTGGVGSSPGRRTKIPRAVHGAAKN